MVKIKPLDEMKKRYEEAATIVPSRYKRAIERVTGWKEKAASDAAEARWEAKIRDAIDKKKRKKALEKVDESEWKKKAAEVGGARIGEGMRKNVDKYTEKFKPFHEALAALELPEKSASWEENIENRLKKVVRTLVETKEKLYE